MIDIFTNVWSVGKIDLYSQFEFTSALCGYVNILSFYYRCSFWFLILFRFLVQVSGWFSACGFWLNCDSVCSLTHIHHTAGDCRQITHNSHSQWISLSQWCDSALRDPSEMIRARWKAGDILSVTLSLTELLPLSLNDCDCGYLPSSAV